jgi:PAS domain S-box-containing protein
MTGNGKGTRYPWRKQSDLFTFVYSILLALVLGGSFWILDGIIGYYYFRESLRFMIFDKPDSLMDSIFTNVSTHALFVRTSFVVACLIGGILAAFLMNRREMALKEARSSEERFRSYFEKGTRGMAVLSIDSGWVEVNDKLCSILGYPKKDLLEMSWSDISHQGDLKSDIRNLNTLLSGREDSFTMEKRFLGKGGKTIHTIMSQKALRSEEGYIDDIIVMVQDITQLKNAEERIVHLNRVLKSISSINQLIIQEKDREILLNKTCIELTRTGGYTNAWIASVDDEGAVEKVFYSGKEENGDYRIPVVGGMSQGELNEFLAGGRALREGTDTRFFNWVNNKAEEKKGKLLVKKIQMGKSFFGILGITVPENITFSDEEMDLFDEVTGDIALGLHDMKIENTKDKAERDLVLERNRARLYLDLLGHDIGNLHQGIIAWLDIAKKSTGDSSVIKNAVEQSYSLTRRSLKLVKNVKLLGSLKQREKNPTRIDLIQTLERSIKDVNEMFPDRELNIHLDLLEERYEIFAEPIVAEIFVNLLHNGIKFQEGPQYKMEVSIRKEDDWTKVSITDHGPGIPDHLKKRMFQRFSKGGESDLSGLGLSLVKSLMERYDGNIQVEDRIRGQRESGTRFVLGFPSAESIKE